MVTFTVALVLLVLGYLVYGGFVNRVFAPDAKRTTPAVEHNDGVDYIPMPTWKIFMIQFLNIAGLGPIFGAIMGAQFGTASYLWIVIGTILAGAVHDFFSGCLSIRNNGANLPELIGKYLGTSAKTVMNVLSLVLMVLVGAVFVSGPAELLAGMTPAALNANFWIVVIFLYYILATLLPIDKIIGRIYPLFAISLLFMAFGILIMLYVKSPELPEMWNGFGTKYEKTPIFPMMFVSIACGAISGFHATQSPLMARCMKSERHCRPIFYGAMITEGIVALIWAAAATWFFGEHGTVDAATGIPYSGAKVATLISKEWLGTIGGVVAILGIVAAPITSGDTALRSARLILADFLHMEQRCIRKRLLICIPLFIVTMATLIYSLADADGFKIIWRYFAWCNQTLSVFTLWAITIYLVQERKPYIITLIPALFMTCVSATYICLAPEGFALSPAIGYSIGGLAVVIAAVWFMVWKKRKGEGLRVKG
ncbi:MAG: carbon starvation protein A [Bacteroidaceae bacterium]|nr:carbon starvation protein A [Bacteroidaceae bacterium]